MRGAPADTSKLWTEIEPWPSLVEKSVAAEGNLDTGLARRPASISHCWRRVDIHHPLSHAHLRLRMREM